MSIRAPPGSLTYDMYMGWGPCDNILMGASGARPSAYLRPERKKGFTDLFVGALAGHSVRAWLKLCAVSYLHCSSASDTSDTVHLATP